MLRDAVLVKALKKELPVCKKFECKVDIRMLLNPNPIFLFYQL